MSGTSKRTQVTGVRLTPGERRELRRIGNGSITEAIRDGIEMLFKSHKVEISKHQ